MTPHNHDSTPVPQLLSLIGQTPLVRVTQLDTGGCELFLKLESQNPAGSIKDRMAAAMVAAAEHCGQLQPGGTIVEATAGNTGIALALIAMARDYRLILVIPDKMSAEKIAHARALGAAVIVTRSDVTKGHPDYYQDRAAAIAAATPGAFYIDQFANPANPAAHMATTAPEIFAQMAGRVDAIVCGVGTGGTMTGLSRFFAEQSPKTELVLADPEGSILAPYINTGRMITPGSWLVEGIGEDFIPANCDLTRVTTAYSISDRESVQAAHILVQKEGILGGSSTGTLLAAALRYCRAQTTPKRVVTFVCDTGNKYLSKLYNPGWLQEHSFL